MTPDPSSGRQQYLEELDAGDGPVSEPETCVVHRKEDYDTYIGRGDGGDAHLNNTEIDETGWLGNPYKTEQQGGDYSRKQSIALYWGDLHYRIEHDPEFAHALAQLKGHRLACYCRRARDTDPTCHGDVLVRVIDGLKPVDSADAASQSEPSGSSSAPADASGER